MVEQRSGYIDNIRLGMIVLVVLVHAAVTYSGIGSWYYKDVGKLSIIETLLFLFFQSFTQSYFMGLLFLLAGYMVPRALEKKGPGGFLRDRLVRLGGPALFYMLAINPFISYFLIGQAKRPFLDYFASYYLGLRFVGGSGPLWFALALLVFSVIYTVVQRRLILGNKHNQQRPYGVLDLIGLIVLITVCTFLVRLVQPIDTSILNMQFCFFSQYIIFFIVGTMAAQERLLDRVDYRLGVRCLQIALVPGIIFWVLMLVIGGAFSLGSVAAFKGGFHWQSLAYAFWESTNGVLISFGLIAVFRERLNKQNNFIKQMSNASFAVYAFHAPILVAISKIMQPWCTTPLIKFIGVSVIALIVSFGLAHLILKRIPLFYTVKPPIRLSDK
ncbi:MAG: hypothetical protein H6Q73_4385 [Firmicutes bacterium]|nr:hypothetical protein [Bacillota bacterium]